MARDERGPPLLEIVDLSVSYGHVEALRHASVEVYPGEIVALIGANGAGKTTLLETALGINAPCGGTVRFRGRGIRGVPVDRNVRDGLCLVPEGKGVFPSMSVRDNLLLGAHHDMKDANRRLGGVYRWFPVLRERERQIAADLSGGERRMLSIGRALMSAPVLIMVDEPSLGLAPIVVRDIFRMLGALNGEGLTILLAEQNARRALECAHRGYVLEEGRVALQGAARELRSDPGVRKAYLGG